MRLVPGAGVFGSSGRASPWRRALSHSLKALERHWGGCWSQSHRRRHEQRSNQPIDYRYHWSPPLKPGLGEKASTSRRLGRILAIHLRFRTRQADAIGASAACRVPLRQGEAGSRCCEALPKGKRPRLLPTSTCRPGSGISGRGEGMIRTLVCQGEQFGLNRGR